VRLGINGYLYRAGSKLDPQRVENFNFSVITAMNEERSNAALSPEKTGASGNLGLLCACPGSVEGYRDVVGLVVLIMGISVVSCGGESSTLCGMRVSAVRCLELSE
jgi:hypothetical protein